jgi:hypothetical protein
MLKAAPLTFAVGSEYMKTTPVARIAAITITTINSIKVKPGELVLLFKILCRFG